MNDTQTQCQCKVGPGKFEGESALTYLAWEQVMIGGSDISTRDEYDHEHDWFRSPLNFDADASVVKAALDYGYCQGCVDAHAEDVYGVEVFEDGQGFVYGTVYTTREDFDAALAEAEAAEPVTEDE